MTTKKVRHVLGLSGGKDSAALAIYMRDRVPEMEYFFCDTHKELKETYDFLDRLKARLGIKIEYLSSERGFDHWLKVYGGFLPSARQRWCTKQLKLAPFEQFIGDDEAYTYIAIRADEDRDGYISTKPNIKPVFPFKEDGLSKQDVVALLEDSGIGMPKYYDWRSRSGCFFCFYQRKYEWVKLAEHHPELFERAKRYESEHKDGRTFTWTEGESLDDLVARREQIIADHEERKAKRLQSKKDKPLVKSLSILFDEPTHNSISDFEDEDEKPCMLCHL